MCVCVFGLVSRMFLREFVYVCVLGLISQMLLRECVCVCVCLRHEQVVHALELLL